MLPNELLRGRSRNVQWGVTPAKAISPAPACVANIAQNGEATEKNSLNSLNSNERERASGIAGRS